MSGFKPKLAGYSSEDKAHMVRCASKLGIKLHSGADFSSDVTHMIAPRGSRTIKVLAATLQGRWLMSSAWLGDSLRAGRLLPEKDYGEAFVDQQPFRHRTFAFSPGFARMREEKKQNARVLIETYGGGVLRADPLFDMTPEQQDAIDRVLITSSELQTLKRAATAATASSAS